MYKLMKSSRAVSETIHSDWGYLQWMVSHGIGNSKEMTVGKVMIKPGMENPRHGHFNCEETLYLLTGRLAHTIGDETVILEPNDTLVVAPGIFHNAKNISPVDSEMIVIYSSGDRDFEPEKTGDRFVGSPVCLPELGKEEILRYYAELGLKEFEIFTNEGIGSYFDISGDNADSFAEIASRWGINIHSFHLPVYRSEDHETSIERIKKAVDAAVKLKAKIVLFKAASKEEYLRSGPELIPFIVEKGLVPVLQNHSNSPLETIDDVEYVLKKMGNKELKILLEVGHYIKAGESWETALEKFKDRIVLVHIKDFKNGESVAFGDGEVDFKKLFHLLNEAEYNGKYVLELEASGSEDTLTRKRSMEKSVKYLMETL